MKEFKILRNSLNNLSGSNSRWNSNLFLATIVKCLTSFVNQDEFISSFVLKGRYYSEELMDNLVLECQYLINSNSLFLEQTIVGILMTFVQQAKVKYNEMNISDDVEIPDEFLDGITCELMRDPVILASGKVCDRSTFQNSMLSDGKDPFTRTPMKEGEERPHTELAKRIRAWISSLPKNK